VVVDYVVNHKACIRIYQVNIVLSVAENRGGCTAVRPARQQQGCRRGSAMVENGTGGAYGLRVCAVCFSGMPSLLFA
jgi:hypothetical protein